MSTRYEVQRLAPDQVDAAAELLADRHRRHRLAVPALDPKFESPSNCAPLISDALAKDGALGAIAFSGGQAKGYVLFTPRDESMWGPNAWAEDTGNAGEGEAIRECYAQLSGELVDGGKRGHWAMVPRSDKGLVEGWFSMSFGMQQAYAYREPVSVDFEPRARDGVAVRRPTESDIPAMMDLDYVLPAHVINGPVFSKIHPPSGPEAEAELRDDLKNDKYTIWVAEHNGRVVATLVGTAVENSSSWKPMMKPVSAALLAYAATLPDARGLGAGRALTDAFMAWARDEAHEWLVTDWRSPNLEANRTWRAMGFRPHFYRLFRAIP